jgi:hypothetical protein
VWGGSEVVNVRVARVAVAVSMMDTVEAAWTWTVGLRHEVVIGVDDALLGHGAVGRRRLLTFTAVYLPTDHINVRR